MTYMIIQCLKMASGQAVCELWENSGIFWRVFCLLRTMKSLTVLLCVTTLFPSGLWWGSTWIGRQSVTGAYEATFLFKAGHHTTFLFLVLSLILNQDSAVSQVVSSASQNLLLLIVFNDNGLFSMVPPQRAFPKVGAPLSTIGFPSWWELGVPHFRKPPKSLLFSVSHSSCCFNHRFHGALFLGGTSSCSSQVGHRWPLVPCLPVVFYFLSIVHQDWDKLTLINGDASPGMNTSIAVLLSHVCWFLSHMN